MIPDMWPCKKPKIIILYIISFFFYSSLLSSLHFKYSNNVSRSSHKLTKPHGKKEEQHLFPSISIGLGWRIDITDFRQFLKKQILFYPFPPQNGSETSQQRGWSLHPFILNLKYFTFYSLYSFQTTLMWL